MAVAFDAVTSSGLQTTDFTFEHTPVGTPRGVLVGVAQRAASEEVDSTAYGAASPSAVAGSPSAGGGAEQGVVHLDFLGSSVPTGAQTVAVNETGGNNKVAWALTVTADADVVVQDTTVLAGASGSGDITGTLSLGGNTCFCGVLVWCGANGVGGFQPLTGWTDRGEVFLGGECVALYTYDTVGTADVTFGIDAQTNTFDYNMIGFALTESAGGGSTGDGTSTLPALEQSATGHMDADGNAAQTLPGVEQAASGAMDYAGTGASTLPGLSQAALGAMDYAGDAASLMPSLTQAATGVMDAAGDGVQTLPGLTQAAAGTHGADAIAYLGSASAGTSDGTDPVIDLTGFGLQEDDVVYVGGFSLDEANNGLAAVLTAGYTPVASATLFGAGAFAVERKVMGATPDSSVTCQGNDETTIPVQYQAVAFRGLNTTTPEDVTPTTATGTSGGPNPPAVDPERAGTANLTFCAKYFAALSQSLTAGPTGYSNFATAAEDVSGQTVAVGSAWLQLAGSSAEDADAFTASTTGLNWAAASLALRPAVESLPIGDGASTLASLTQAATGGMDPAGDAASILAALEQAASGGMDPAGDAAQILPSLEQLALAPGAGGGNRPQTFISIPIRIGI